MVFKNELIHIQAAGYNVARISKSNVSSHCLELKKEEEKKVTSTYVFS